MALRHFLTLRDLSSSELQRILARASELKRLQHEKQIFQPFVGKVLGMIFEKSSTRTRISFEAGINQFGGSAIFLSPRDTQLGRGEPIEDSARVISSMLDIVMIRTFGHEIVEQFASYSKVPVINGLTDDHHPCQLLLMYKPIKNIVAVLKVKLWHGLVMAIICVIHILKLHI
jgi:ornithine carbamoyltransferase